MAEGFDAATALSGVAVAAAGRSFVCRYVGAYPGDPRATSAGELADDIAHGVTPVLNYEGSGKDATSFANGAADARYAQGRVAALGFPTAVIYFSVDEQYAADIVAYFKGVESVIGHDRTGVYGGWDTVTTLHNAGLCAFFWMTYAWEFSRPVPAFVHIYQYLNGQTVNGMSVDFDRSQQDYFGQIGPNVAGGGAHPFNPPVNLQEEDMPTFIKTPTRGTFNAAPGVLVNIDPAFPDQVQYVANQVAPNGPRALVLNVADTDLENWAFCLTGCPKTEIPTVPGYAWIAAVEDAKPATAQLSDAQVQALESGVSSAVAAAITASGVALSQAQVDAIAAESATQVRAIFKTTPLQ